jgi:type IV secretory pathway VirB10-like protein
MDSLLQIIGMLTRVFGPVAVAVSPLVGCVILAYLLKVFMGFNFAISFFILLCIMAWLVLSGTKKLEIQRKKAEARERKIEAMKAKRRKERQAEQERIKLENEQKAKEAHEAAKKAHAEGKEVSIADLEEDIVPLRQMQNPLDRKPSTPESTAEAATDTAQKPGKQKQANEQAAPKKKDEPPAISDEDLEKIDLSEFDDPDFKI